MKNFIQIISDAGVELTEEQQKAIEAGANENYRTVSDYEKQKKKIADMTAERDQWKSQYETAAETLKGFDGKDFDAITKERDEWKQRAEQSDVDFKKQLEEAEKKYTQQIEERDFNDVLVKALSSEKFTSDFAKTGIINMIKDKGLKREGEKILGLDDYMKELHESQKDAFAPSEEVPKPPTYTTPTQSGDTGEKKISVPKVW